MGSVSFAVAYAGGLLTLFSPCSALIIPSFFAYAFASRTQLAGRMLVFFLGLLAGLLPLGVALGTLGGFLTSYLRSLTLWGGILIIFFGVWQALALPIPRLPRRHRRKTLNMNGTIKQTDRTSPFAIFLLGLTYGLAATGCSGPIMGAISAFALTGGSPFTGFFIMAFFSLGMYTPVVVLAFLWESIPSRFLTPRPITVLGRPSTLGTLVSGLIFVVLGAVMAVFGGGGLSSSLLTASKQAQIENTARELLAGVPDWLFLALIVLLAGALVVYLWPKYKRRSSTHS